MAGKDISTLAVILTSTVGPFVAGLSQASSSTTNFISVLTKLTGVTLAVEAATELAKQAFEIPKAAYEAAKEQAQGQTRLAAVLKATGNAAGFSAEQLNQQAEALSKSTIYDDDAITGFQSVLATFRNVSGNAFKDATSLALDMNSVMGGDLTGTAVQLGKALNDPTEGITALRRVGVSFTTQQEKQIQTMQKSGDLAGAQAIVLAELRSEFGGVAEAMAQTPFGKLTQLSNQLFDTLKPLGATIAMVGARLAVAFHVSDLMSAVSAGFVAIQGSVETGLDAIAPYIDAFVPKAVSAFWSMVSGVETAFNAVYGVVAPVVAGVFNYVSTYWGAIVGVTGSVLAGMWGVVSGIWSTVYAYIAGIVTDVWNVIATNWGSIVDTTVDAFTSVYTLIESVLGAAWSFISGTVTGLANLWATCWSAMGFDVLTTGDMVTAVSTGIGGALQWLEQLVSGTMTLISFAFNNAGTIIAAALVGTAYEGIKFGNDILYVFTDMLPAGLNWLATNWMNILTDIGNFQNTVLQNMLKNAGSFAGALWSAIKGEGFNFEFTSLTEGFKSSLTELPKIADRQIGGLEKSLGDQSKTLGDSLYQGLGQAFIDQDTKSKAASSAIKDTMKGLGNSIKDAFAKPPTIAPIVKPPVIKPPELKINNQQANAAIDETAKKGEKLDAIFSGSAESINARMQAEFDSWKVTPDVAPAPPVNPAAPVIAGMNQPVAPVMPQIATPAIAGAVATVAQQQYMMPPTYTPPSSAAVSAAPVAAPLPTAATASVNGGNNDSPMLDKIVALMARFDKWLINIDTNTATPQFDQADV